MTPELFKWSQVTLSSKCVVLFYFGLMSCNWANHQKDQTCIELNHWSRVCPGKWKVSHLLNNFSNLTQTKFYCRRISSQHQWNGLILLVEMIILLVEP